MTSESQLTLKKIEISINNFNSAAIPHYIDLLSKHHENVKKFQTEKNYIKAQNEHVNATRIIIQLEQLLEEMDALRRQLNPQDEIKFDRLTDISRKKTSRAIAEYIETFKKCSQFTSTYDPSGCISFATGDFDKSHDSDVPTSSQLQTKIADLQISQDELINSEFYLKEWDKIEEKAQGIHELMVKLDEVVKIQAEPVNSIEKNCESSAVAVDEGRRLLYKAENLNAKWYPVAGAAIGSLIAGPVGLVMGIKIGIVALMGGSAMGFTGGKLIKKNKQISNAPATDA